jgi:integrase
MATNIKTRTGKTGTRYTAMYKTAEGQWRSAGSYSRRDIAREQAILAAEKASKSDWTDPRSGKITLDAYVTQVWLPSLTVEVTTRQNYQASFRLHIRPRFGDVPVANILPSAVAKWIADMDRQGVGRSAAGGAYRVLSIILNAARRDRVIAINPAEAVSPKPVAQHEIQIFSRPMWDKFLGELPEQWQSLMKVACYTGLRPSELRALAPAQINWMRQELIVDRSLVQVNATENGGEPFVVKNYPKGKRSRRVPLTEEVLEILFGQFTSRGLAQDSQEPMFPSFRAERVSILFRDACKAAGLPPRVMKDLRSTYASWRLKDTNGDLVRVQQELGHANITTTQKYLAVVEEAEDDNVSAFERFRQKREAL